MLLPIFGRLIPQVRQQMGQAVKIYIDKTKLVEQLAHNIKLLGAERLERVAK